MDMPIANIETAREIFPVTLDEAGVLRVGHTRVTLDSVVEAFERGASAEEIAGQFSVLSLADVYGAISYYLHRHTEVQTYLHTRQVQAQAMQVKAEQGYAPIGTRARLMAQSKVSR